MPYRTPDWHHRRCLVASYCRTLELLDEWKLGRLHDALIERACSSADPEKRRLLLAKAGIVERVYLERYRPAACSS